MFDQIDMVMDLQDLRKLGLTEDEIAGYFSFFEKAYKKENIKAGDQDVYEIQ